MIKMRDPHSLRELKKLCDYLKKLPCYTTDLPVVELGSYTGESTEVFALNLENDIISIDPWIPGYDNLDPASVSDFREVAEAYYQRMGKYTNVYHYDKIKPAEVMFVYIDACHKYECVKEDILKWRDFTRVIGGHDFIEDPAHPHVYGVQKAVRETIGEPDIIFGDSSWIKYL